ncbi:DNA polymerase III subunit epsilon [biofilm metagenome]
MLNPIASNRLVVLDTETTGLNPQEGHRVIEIGCVELVNRRFTGNRFHVYLNPDREVDSGAMEVHGITSQFLSDKPRFTDIVDDFVAFIKDAELIIHNAPFDVGFLNHEFSLIPNNAGCVDDFSTVFDTLAFARKKHPGQRNSLDALCKRYAIDNSHREFHGALLDAEILAEVFLCMTGGQSSLLEDAEITGQKSLETVQTQKSANSRPDLRVILCSEHELAEHQKTLDMIKNSNGLCLWAD